jgi:hypothetical protein
MAAESDMQRMTEQAMDKRAEWAAQQPSLVAELKAMAREAVKDIRESVVEQGWFGQRDGPGEPGTPLNPTPQMVTQDLGTVYGSYDKALDSYQQEGPQQSYTDMLREASQRGGQEQDRDPGMDR